MPSFGALWSGSYQRRALISIGISLADLLFYTAGVAHFDPGALPLLTLVGTLLSALACSVSLSAWRAAPTGKRWLVLSSLSLALAFLIVMLIMGASIIVYGRFF